MKRNSWFVVKYETTVDVSKLNWLPGGKKWGRAIQRQFADNPQAAVAMQVSLKTHIIEKRTYWREDWKETDPLEGVSVWTDYRREAVKFQKRTDAEGFAFKRTHEFPPYIGLLKVERLRWNPSAKGPCGPMVEMRYSLAT